LAAEVAVVVAAEQCVALGGCAATEGFPMGIWDPVALLIWQVIAEE